MIHTYTETQVLNHGLLNAFNKKPQQLYVPYEEVKELIKLNEKLTKQLTSINAIGFLPETDATKAINNES